MLDQRNDFITNMNNSITNHKKNFNTLLSKLGWTLQSVTAAVKDEDNADQQNQHEISTINDELRKEDDVKDESTVIIKSEKENEGTSKDSEKLYNELLASLSFQPKVKKEKLSDTELLASLLETERNAKRRRISYRNKIHTKNKSHTEVLREVIREQMEVLKFNDDESENDKCNTNEKKEDNYEMLEVNVTDGNPHLAWQSVGLVLEDHQKEIEGKHHKNQRVDSHTSNNWHKTSDHRKYHHSKYNSKHHKSSSYYDKSLKYYISTDDRNKKSTHDREKSSKSYSSSKYVDRNSGQDKSPRHRHRKRESKARRSASQEHESKNRNKRKKKTHTGHD